MQTFTLSGRANHGISGRFFYQMREEQGVQPPGLTLTRSSGSCRDFAALFMEACRQRLDPRLGRGLPARRGVEGIRSPQRPGDRHIAVTVARYPEAVPPVAGSFIGPPGLLPSLSGASHRARGVSAVHEIENISLAYPPDCA